MNALTRNKWTALHKACEGGHLNVVKLLIENGASVNIENICEWRALHIACCYDHMSVACYLIENGANVNALTNGKETPFHKVCEFGESVEMLRALIRYGADVNALNYQKCNGLHFAAANGNTDIVLELIKNGLNMNALNEMNKTPLELLLNVEIYPVRSSFFVLEQVSARRTFEMTKQNCSERFSTV